MKSRARKDFIRTLWLTIPVLVFSFNHSPKQISSFSQSQQRQYQDQALTEHHAGKSLRGAAGLLLFL